MSRLAWVSKSGVLALLVAASAAVTGHAAPGGSNVTIVSKTDAGLVISPGDTMDVGFVFTLSGKHPATNVQTIGNITFDVVCANGDQASFSINPPGTTYSVAENYSGWTPAGKQSDAAVYQQSAAAPDVCGGASYQVKNGATFSYSIVPDQNVKINVKFHWRANGSAGGYSGTKTVTPIV